MKNLQLSLNHISRSSLAHRRLAKKYLESLAMPTGALADMQKLICQLAAIYRKLPFKGLRKVHVLAAADHGVVAQGVSKYPQITDAIVKTALSGGAGINAFCKQSDCDLKIVNAGLCRKVIDEGLIDCSSKLGTDDFTLGPAMSRKMCLEKIERGIEFSHKLDGYDILSLGEMGIGNTSSAAALTAVLCNLPVEHVTGVGTGIGREQLSHKVSIVKKAIDINKPNKRDSLDTLSKLGGFEVAFMTGVILGWAQQKKAIILDGFITGTAALVAVKLQPNVKDYLIAGHQSAEPGHSAILKTLSLKPIVKLNLRLGEGIGAVLALQTIETAIETMNSMMTLNEALKL